MTRQDVNGWLERHWKVLALVFLAGSYAGGSAIAEASQDRAIGAKADTATVLRELRAINRRLDSIDSRQRQFFCLDQPVYCR